MEFEHKQFYLEVVLVAKSRLTLVSPWTVARQAPLSMGFSRQEYWSGLPFPSPGDIFPTQELNPGLLHCRQILYWLSYEGSPFIWRLCSKAGHIATRTQKTQGPRKQPKLIVIGPPGLFLKLAAWVSAFSCSVAPIVAPEVQQLMDCPEGSN